MAPRNGNPAHVAHLYEDEEGLGLRSSGFETEAALERGQIVAADADEALERILVNGVPEVRRFRPWAEGLLRDVSGNAPFPRSRIYCELSDILAGKGAFPAGDLLEQWWDELARERSFPLLCSYGTVAFAGAGAAGNLRAVCAAHTEVICG